MESTRPSSPASLCPFCRAELGGGESWRCPACATPHHLECAREHGRCTVHGCRGGGSFQAAPPEEPRARVVVEPGVAPPPSPLVDRRPALVPLQPWSFLRTRWFVRAALPWFVASVALGLVVWRSDLLHGFWTRRSTLSEEEMGLLAGLRNLLDLALILGPPLLANAAASVLVLGRVSLFWWLERPPEFSPRGR